MHHHFMRDPMRPVMDHLIDPCFGDWLPGQKNLAMLGTGPKTASFSAPVFQNRLP
jgi:hypothetical protein